MITNKWLYSGWVCLLFVFSCMPKQNWKTITGSHYKAILIPKGTLQIDCALEECDKSKNRAYQFKIPTDFYMMKTEVTKQLYQSVIGYHYSSFKDCGLDCPADNIHWTFAAQFANELSKKEGLEQCYVIQSNDNVSWPKGTACKGWRFPTEAEWEYAARKEPRDKYARSDRFDQIAWYDNQTHPVCTKNPNGYGLCDMYGNVWEWVWGWYDNADEDPTKETKSYINIFDYNGGRRATVTVVKYLHVTNEYRYISPPYYSDFDGFRLVRSSP